VNRLMKQFDQTRKMMRMVAGADQSKMRQMAAAMKNMKGGRR
jgi:signal recognition particle subunit SRP54